MTLSPGTTLGPYEILAPLGVGGMGEVYRARDTRLGRDVAIKALPSEFAQEPERLSRFEREAKLLASLSHPNIAGIHGLEVAAGTPYLVLEFIEGETLARRLQQGALPVDDATRVCAQVAAGVEAAHEAGIIHRDLKPGNVMLKPDGTVKVLDFGLAKSGWSGGSGSDPRLSASPTLSRAATGAGVILGTAAYMSPEQARGKPVDRRTDVWSFGCVLYECLTGKQLFVGETVSDVIASILQKTPDWSALPRQTPPRVRRLLERCLDREPKRRLRDIGEARIALENTAGALANGTPATGTTTPRRLWPRVAWSAALVVLTTIVAAVVTRQMVRPPAPEPVALSIMLPRGEHLESPSESNLLAIARNGRAVVYAASGASGQRLVLRRLDQPDAIEIPGTSDARTPFFSPDGEWIGYFAGRKLYKVSVRGGTPLALADVAADRGGTWLDDGSIVYTPTFASPLYRIDASGGTPQAITSIDSTRGERTHRWPCALPGGKWVVFTVGRTDSPGGYDDAAIEAVSIATGERRELARGGCARYVKGQLILARGGSLYALPLDPRDPRGGATPVPVLDGVLGIRTSGIAFFDIARNGTLALVPGLEGEHRYSLAWTDLAGSSTPLPVEARAIIKVNVSPDGTRALADVGPGGGASDVFLLDLRNGNLNQITFDGHSGSAVWLPDGQTIVWARQDGSSGGVQIVKRSLLGEDEPVVLVTSPLPVIISDVVPDGSAVVFNEYGRPDADVLMVPTDGSGKIVTLVSEPQSQTDGAVSPDGRWIAYVSNETGGSLICVRPTGRSGGRVQISRGGGGYPEWSADGRELYYAAGGAMIAATLSVQGGTLVPTSTRRLFALPSRPSDSSLRGFSFDGSSQRFLLCVPAGNTSELREIDVRLNWAQAISP